MQERAVLRIILADDHSLIRHGIKNLIKKRKGLRVVGEVNDGDELLALLKTKAADLVVLDISMRKTNGIDTAMKVKKIYPWVKILMLTMHYSQQVFYNAMIAGADGYLLKDDSDSEFWLAIEKVSSGKTYISPSVADDFTGDVIDRYRNGKKIPFLGLSQRENEILQLVVDGLTSKKMAENLGLSQRTIEHHRSNLLKKLKKKNSVDLASFAVRNGFTSSQ